MEKILYTAVKYYRFCGRNLKMQSMKNAAVWREYVQEPDRCRRGTTGVTDSPRKEEFHETDIYRCGS